jgi:hypothetical protein
LVLSLVLALSWLDLVEEHGSLPGWLPALSAGLGLGTLALSRPLTALGVGIPFGFHGLYLIARGSSVVRRRVLLVGAVTLLVAGLHFLWQFAVTGDALLNPYTLWWEYDKFGFGPGYGVEEGGHNLKLAWYNTKHSLRVGLSDLFGWGRFSWLFLPFGAWALRRRRDLWPLLGVFPVLVLLHTAYWVGAWVFGPRYYYEGLYSLTLMSAAGITWLAGRSPGSKGRNQVQAGGRKARFLLTATLVLLLVSANLRYYLPQRVGGMQGLFGIQRSQLDPFLTPEAQSLTPALVIVHPEDWRQYCVLLDLSSPYFDSPFVFVYSRGSKTNAEIRDQFPNRTLIHYYPEKPYKLYLSEIP